MNALVAVPTAYVIDPQRDGYDTNVFKTVTGTPAVTSNVLRFNVAETIMKLDHLWGRFVFNLKIPVKPTSGDIREFGLKQLNFGNAGKIAFNITDTAFTSKTYSNDGSQNTSKPITWDDTNWSAKAIEFIIDWYPDRAAFYVNGLLKTQHRLKDNYAGVVEVLPRLPVSPFIKNSNADNVDMAYLIGQHVRALV